MLVLLYSSLISLAGEREIALSFLGVREERERALSFLGEGEREADILVTGMASVLGTILCVPTLSVDKKY